MSWLYSRNMVLYSLSLKYGVDYEILLTLQERIFTKKKRTNILLKILRIQDKFNKKQEKNWTKIELDLFKKIKQRWLFDYVWWESSIPIRTMDDSGTHNVNGNAHKTEDKKRRMRAPQKRYKNRQPNGEFTANAYQRTFIGAFQKNIEDTEKACKWPVCVNLRCLLELVEEYLPDKCLDGEQSAPLNVMPTARQFWRNDKMTDCSIFSRFGLTWKHLTEQDGEELLMLYQADFPVRISAQQDEGRELEGAGQDYGRNSLESLARYDQAMYSLKTAQCSLTEDSTEFCVTLPKWGSMRNGVVSQRQKSVRHTSVSASGLLPTPTATDYKGSKKSFVLKRVKKRTHGLTLREFLAKYTDQSKTVYPSPGLMCQMMGWPIEWTKLKPLVTDKCRNVLLKHGIF